MERTLAIIKPDAVEKRCTGKILTRIEEDFDAVVARREGARGHEGGETCSSLESIEGPRSAAHPAAAMYTWEQVTKPEKSQAKLIKRANFTICS